MREFKVGDKVKVIEQAKYGMLPVDYCGKITQIKEKGSILVDNKLGGWFYGNSGGELELINKYPNPPHKHAELIKAWADGANIQFYSQLSNKWKNCNNNNPSWFENMQYRIESNDPNEDKIKKLKKVIDKASEEINNAKEQLEKLENEYDY